MKYNQKQSKNSQINQINKIISWSSICICAWWMTESSFAADTQPADSPDTLIATINGTPYPLDVFRMFYLERLQQAQGENAQAVQQQAFDEFMTLVVTAQEGERRKLGGDRGVMAALQLSKLKALSTAAVEAMAKEIEPTDDDLKAAYEKIKSTTRIEYKARHILVKEEDEAKKLIKQLDKGADFAELAKKNSLGPTGKNGGELDWFEPGRMVPAFASAVVAMQPGTYSKEPVHTQFGWHIINLQQTRKADPPSFEDSKPQLIALVQRQKISERIAEMRNKSLVDLNESIVKINKDQPAEDKTESKEKSKNK